MATIDSVDLYLGLSSAKSGFDVTVGVYTLSAVTNDPDTGILLGSKSMDVDNIPLISGVGPDWVTFTFDTPITVSENGYAGIVFSGNGSAFDQNSIRSYYAQDYDYYISGAQDGTERFYRESSGNWILTGSSIVLCYRLNGTDITQNVADNPSASYYVLSGATAKHGWRAYTDGAPSAPTKAENPSPTNTNTSVTLDQATITWDDGGNADTFDVYYGTTSGSLTLVSSAQAGTSFTVTGITDGAPYSYLSVRYWRIDSTNVGGTTTGDEWSFTTIRFTPVSVTYFYSTTGQYYRLLIQSDGSYGDPPGVGVENVDYVYLAAGYEANFISTNRKLVAAAENRIWYEDI